MESKASAGRSVARYFLLLFGLCIPFWVIGAFVDIEIFPGFKLFQMGLAMPMVAALILTFYDHGWAGTAALLRRTYDAHRIKPLIWLLPIFLVIPSVGAINYWIMRQVGFDIAPPTFSWVVFLGYCTVFFMTYAEELGLTGYALDPLQKRYSALVTGLILGLVWAAYHIPGFVISGYYTAGWILWQSVCIVLLRVLFVWIYNNAGQSLFSMALCHWTYGLVWSLWPQDNLQLAVSFYRPEIAAGVVALYVVVVVALWGPKTLAQFRLMPRQ